MMVLKRVGFLVNTLNTAKGPKPLCFLPTDLKLRHQSLVVKQALFSSSHCAFQAALRCSQSTFSIGLPRPGRRSAPRAVDRSAFLGGAVEAALSEEDGGGQGAGRDHRSASKDVHG